MSPLLSPVSSLQLSPPASPPPYICPPRKPIAASSSTARLDLHPFPLVSATSIATARVYSLSLSIRHRPSPTLARLIFGLPRFPLAPRQVPTVAAHPTWSIARQTRPRGSSRSTYNRGHLLLHLDSLDFPTILINACIIGALATKAMLKISQKVPTPTWLEQTPL